MSLLKWLCLFLLVCANAAQASPPGGEADDMHHGPVLENTLLTQLDDVRHSVADKAINVADKATELVLNARGFLGLPYKRGGSNAESGFDCSGFVRAVYEKTIGLILPRRADQQAANTTVIDKKDLQPGDLVFFNTMRRAFSHVGIYLGDGKFVHSPRTGGQVRIEDMRISYWQRRFDGARRVPPIAATAVPSNEASESAHLLAQ